MPQHDIPAQSAQPRINLGSDPGNLIAALPALLGFTPEESLVFVGLYNSSSNGRTMRIGPVVRADLNYESLARGMATFVDTMQPLDTPEVVLIAVSEKLDEVPAWLDVVTSILHEEAIEINGVHIVEEFEEGAAWYRLDGSLGGAIGDVADNPLRTMGKCMGAVHLGSREERDEWLRPTSPRLSITAELRDFDIPFDAHNAGSAVTACGMLLQNIETGERTLEDATADDEVLNLLARMCLDEDLHAVLILFSQGTINPVMRDLMAQVVRRSRGAVRRRALVILAFILGSNDEGSLSYHALSRSMEEGKELPSKAVGAMHDELTEDMAHRLLGAHHEGHVRFTIQAVLIHAINFLANLVHHCQQDWELCEDCEEGFSELCEDDCWEEDFRDAVCIGADSELPREFSTREDMMAFFALQAIDKFDEVTPEERLDFALDGLEWPAIHRALALPAVI